MLRKIHFDKLYRRNPVKFAGKIAKVLKMLSAFGMSRLVKREGCEYYDWMERIVRPWTRLGDTDFVEPVQMSDPSMFDYCHDGTYVRHVVELLQSAEPFRSRMTVFGLIESYEEVSEPKETRMNRFRTQAQEFRDSAAQDIALFSLSGHQYVMFKEGGEYHVIDPNGNISMSAEDNARLADVGFPTVRYHEREREQHGPTCVSAALARAIYMLVRKHGAADGAADGGVEYTVSMHEPLPCSFAYFTAQLVQFANLPHVTGRESLAKVHIQQIALAKGTIARRIREYFELPHTFGPQLVWFVGHFVDDRMDVPVEIAESFFSEAGLMSLPDDKFVFAITAMCELTMILSIQLDSVKTFGDRTKQFFLRPPILARVRAKIADTLRESKAKVYDSSTRLDVLSFKSFKNLRSAVMSLKQKLYVIQSFMTLITYDMKVSPVVDEFEAVYGIDAMEKGVTKVLELVGMWFPLISEDYEIFYQQRIEVDVDGPMRGQFPMTLADINWDDYVDFVDVAHVRSLFLDNPAHLFHWYKVILSWKKRPGCGFGLINPVLRDFRRLVHSLGYMEMFERAFSILDMYVLGPRHQRELNAIIDGYPEDMKQILTYWTS